MISILFKFLANRFGLQAAFDAKKEWNALCDRKYTHIPDHELCVSQATLSNEKCQSFKAGYNQGWYDHKHGITHLGGELTNDYCIEHDYTR